jgi:hypothetical protein
MAEAREPMADDNFMIMTGLKGRLDFNNLIYTPFTGWSRENAYFDGIKYTAPIMQNPWFANPDDESIHSQPPPSQEELIAQQYRIHAIITEVKA